MEGRASFESQAEERARAREIDSRRKAERERGYRRALAVALVVSAFAHVGFFAFGGLDGVPLFGDGSASNSLTPERAWTQQPIQVVQVRERVEPPATSEPAALETAEAEASASSSSAARSTSFASAPSAGAPGAGAPATSAGTVLIDIRPVDQLRPAGTGSVALGGTGSEGATGREGADEEKEVRSLADFMPESVRPTAAGLSRPAFRSASNAVGTGRASGFGGSGGHCSTPPVAINRAIGQTVLIGR